MVKNKIVFLCGARDYHALDWYKSAKLLLKNYKIEILTDILSAEGLNNLTNSDDKVVKLFIIDNLLFKKQTKFANFWRNFIKFLVIPIQVLLLKSYYKKNIGAIFYAHGMYHMYLAAIANIPYSGTPQGSEILVRPQKSLFYRLFAKTALRNAIAVSVDSNSMRIKMIDYFGVNPFLIQNGIDLNAIDKAKELNKLPRPRNRYTSIRGISPLYRIHELINVLSNKNIQLTLLYPFFDKIYLDEFYQKLKYENISYVDLGRLNRNDLYNVLFESKVVFSFPISDSSPRSVYESIFCGAVVIISYQPYYDDLPKCMRNRIVLVDLSDANSIKSAFERANELSSIEFIPSAEAINMFNQEKTFLLLASKLCLL